MNRVLVSTGTFIGRFNNRNYRLIPEYAPKFYSDGFEFMFYKDKYETAAEIPGLLGGISFPTMHIEKTLSEEIQQGSAGISSALKKFEINCKTAKALGSKLLVFHLWNGLPSDENIALNIKLFGNFNAIAKDYGLFLTVENIPCHIKDPFTHFYALAEKYDDVRFTIDTKFLVFHKQFDELYGDKSKWLWERIRHIHSNDYASAPYDWDDMRTLHIGDGKIDFQRLFDCCRRNGYKGDFTLECSSLTENGPLFDKMNQSVEKIRGFIGK